MTRYTEANREEARHEAWIESGGPAKFTETHARLAFQYIALHMTDWTILSHERIRENDAHVLEVVVRRGDDVRLIRWNSFNKGFMTNYGTVGWIIFDPKAVR